jgi:hypothetical protein
MLSISPRRSESRTEAFALLKADLNMPVCGERLKLGGPSIGGKGSKIED